MANERHCIKIAASQALRCRVDIESFFSKNVSAARSGNHCGVNRNYCLQTRKKRYGQGDTVREEYGGKNVVGHSKAEKRMT